MSVITIALLGIVVVLSCILILRLHPLIALLLGSLFLFVLTPPEVRFKNESAGALLTVDGLSSGLVGFTRSTPEGTYVLLDAETPHQDASKTLTLRLASPEELLAANRAVGGAPVGLIWYKVISDAPIQISLRQQFAPQESLKELGASRFRGVGKKLAEAFAKTFRRLGIPVTMAAIIGICLLESGAAARLVSTVISVFGRRSTGPALTLSGFVLGVPVYFDNVFYLLLPLAKAVGRQQPRQYLTAVMAIIVGATMAHSLVPPTPGPLLVASELGVSIGKMMLGGLVVGAAAVCVGYAYGALCYRWVTLEQDVGDELTDTPAEPPVLQTNSLWLAATRTCIAAIPIALPIAILSGSEILKTLTTLRFESALFNQWLPTLESANAILSDFSDPNLIFLGTALIALAILRWYTSRAVVAKSISKGLSDAGTILLLTCAGGAFGAALQQLGLADAIGSKFAGLNKPWVMLTTAFLLTTIIRAAQGSATVAMITSVAIVSPLIEKVELPFNTLYIALAIGCGSKPLPWMNDSGFWQVATMTGMNTGQTLKTFTVALTLMGLTGFAVVLLGAWLLPFA
ncbi:MAG: SLC13 family permease [Pirellulaceae bacterium]